MILGATTLALLSGAPAYAKKDGVSQGSNMSPQHISQQGRESAKGKMMAQEKGTQRATERKSDQGLDHGMSGQRDGQGNAQGH